MKIIITKTPQKFVSRKEVKNQEGREVGNVALGQHYGHACAINPLQHLPKVDNFAMRKLNFSMK